MRTSIFIGLVIVAEAIRPSFEIPTNALPIVVAIFIVGMAMDIFEFFKNMDRD